MITTYSKPDLLYIVIQNTMDRNSKRASLVYINQYYVIITGKKQTYCIFFRNKIQYDCPAQKYYTPPNIICLNEESHTYPYQNHYFMKMTDKAFAL